MAERGSIRSFNRAGGHGTYGGSHQETRKLLKRPDRASSGRDCHRSRRVEGCPQPGNKSNGAETERDSGTEGQIGRRSHLTGKRNYSGGPDEHWRRDLAQKYFHFVRDSEKSAW